MKQLKFGLIGAGQRGAEAYSVYAFDHAYELKFTAVAEPDDVRRELFKKDHSIADNLCFKNFDEFFKVKPELDAILICTQDQQHTEMAVKALEAGYNILLEKPMSNDAKECIEINECAKKNNRTVTVCHVLRYTQFFKKLKDILESGKIGKLINIQHNENVGFEHIAHSFVRGNWRNTAESSPMILAKCCHDMDILLWLAGGKCKNISSFGSRMHFSEENKLNGAAERCIECPVEHACPYSAMKIYLYSGKTGWPTSVITQDTSREGVIKALKEGPYGRCVYACDNDVVDNQVVILEFENGVNATLIMSGFTHETSRTLKLMGSKGEIRAHMEKNIIEIHDFVTGTVEEIHIDIGNGPKGHGDGDVGIMREFVALIRDGKSENNVSDSDASVHSHLMSFAAEKARLEKRIINLEKFEKEISTK